MLDASVEYPEVPVQFWDIQRLPVVFTIEGVSPELSQHVVYHLLKELSSRATENAARLYSYNKLAKYNWNNNEFAELVKETAFAAVLFSRSPTASGDPLLHAEQAARTFVSYYTSKQAVTNRELKSLLPSRLVHVANQNLTSYHDTKARIQAMYPNQQYPSQQYFYNNPPTQGTGMMAQPQQFQPQPFMQPPQQVFPQAPMGYQPQGFNRPMQPPVVSDVQTPAVLNGRYANQDMLPPSREFFQPEVMEVSMPAQTRAAQPSQCAPAATDPVTVTMQIVGGSEMDRARHEVFVIDEFSYSAEPAMTAFVESKKEFTSGVFDENPQCLSDEVYSDFLTLQEFHTHTLQARLGLGEDKIYRVYGTKGIGLVVSRTIQDFAQCMESQTTIDQLIIRLKSLLIASQSSASARQYTVAIVTLDNFLTKYYNDYIRYGLGLDVDIDSVINDRAALMALLREKYPKKHTAFAEYEKNMHNVWLGGVREALDPTSDAGYFEERICLMHSVTFLNVTKAELGIKIPKHKRALIDKVITPTLYELARTLEYTETRLNLKSAVDLFCTQDGQYFRVFTDTENKDLTYWIVPWEVN